MSPDPEDELRADLARAVPLSGVLTAHFLPGAAARITATAEAAAREAQRDELMFGASWSVPIHLTDVDWPALLAAFGYLVPRPRAATERTRSRRWRAGTRRTKRHARRPPPDLRR